MHARTRQDTRRHSAVFGAAETAETDFRVSLFPFVDLGKCNLQGLELSLQFQLSFDRSKSALGDPNCELFPQGTITPVPPSAPPYRPVGAYGNNWVVFPGRDAKRKPSNQRVRGLLFPLFRWWLCPAAMPKQHQAVLGSTKTRVQKPVPVIPTRWSRAAWT